MYIYYIYTVACKELQYGKNCSLVCSPNCKTCRHTDGFCTCKAGWTGTDCTTGNQSERTVFQMSKYAILVEMFFNFK